MKTRWVTEMLFEDAGFPVLGDDGLEVGRVRLLTAVFPGLPEGLLLEADWGRDSAFVFAAPGLAAISRSGGRDYAYRLQIAAAKKPYSSADPWLDECVIADALSGPKYREAWYSVLRPVAERFLAEGFDPEFLNVPRLGRRPTGREYAFLAERGRRDERRCAVTAFPPLLAYLVAGLERRDPSHFRRIADAIDDDADRLLVPVLAKEFGTGEDAVRALHEVPGLYPYAGWSHAIGSVEFDLRAWTRAFEFLDADLRPATPKDCEAFQRILAWADMLVESADFRDRRAAPELAAEIWAHHGRDVKLPYWEIANAAWADGYRAVADAAYPGTWRGNACGGEADMTAGAWTVAAMVTASSPYDLTSPYSSDPATVADVFAYAKERFGLVRLAAEAR